MSKKTPAGRHHAMIVLVVVLGAAVTALPFCSSFTTRTPQGIVHKASARASRHHYHSAQTIQILPSSLPPPPQHQTLVSRITTTTKACVPTMTSSSALSMAMNPMAIARSTSTSIGKRIVAVLSAARRILWNRFARLLWPGTGPDKSFSEPLPPGALGCPLFGDLGLFSGSKEHGPFAGMAKKRKLLGNPKVFRLYAAGMPITSVSGPDNFKSVLSHEFEEGGGGGVGTQIPSPNTVDIFGTESVLYEQDKKKHSSLRRLVGSAMSPTAMNAAIPTIQRKAEEQVDWILKEAEGDNNIIIKMEDAAVNFTLDIAHEQILGLGLKDGEEVEEFHRQVKVWVAGSMNPIFFLPFRIPFLKQMKTYKSYRYVVSKIEEKLARLDRDGPDGSTLSNMYFATDDDGDDDTPRKLTRQQVIDNAVILIIAGYETSSSTLTVAFFLLGMYPEVWKKIKKEQSELQLKHGDALTRDVLGECTYLEAVIKETMRIRPIDGPEFRKTKKTLVVDGEQIPKNSMIYLNIRQSHEQDEITYKEDGSHMDVKKGFNPDRWLHKDTKPSIFLGFGDGSHRCLGERLAMTEMKIFLASCARKFDFDLVSEEVAWDKDAFMSRPMDGARVVLHKH